MPLSDYITYVAPTNPEIAGPGQDCDLFGACASLIRYLPLDASDCGGRLNADPQDPVEIRIEVQPMKEEDMPEKMGHRIEALYRFWFNPSHPVNLAAAEALGYVGMPLFLRTADSEFVVGAYDSAVERGHADVILWQGQQLKLITLMNWDRKLCSATLCDTLELQEGTMCLMRGDYSEREANIDNDTFASEGTLV